MKARAYRIVLAVLAVLVLALPGAASAATKRPADIRLTRIGNPVWKPVDVHIFSAPLSSTPGNYDVFGQTMQKLLPPPNHVMVDGLGIGPGAAHPGPYDHEFADGIRANGYNELQPFTKAEFTPTNGLYMVWMTVADPGVIGPSPDSAAGPVIPNRLFPLHVQGIARHNGTMFDPYLAWPTDVPALDQVKDKNGQLVYPGQNHSHFPMFAGEDASFGPAGGDLVGPYDFIVTETDNTGSGWIITAHFTIGS